MSISNLNNVHLKEAEVTTAKNALDDLEAALKSINVNLTAADRQKYGSINEQNKLMVNKVYDYNKNEPNLNSPDVDWAEFELGYTSRQNYESIIARLESLTKSLKNAKILHDYDNYQNALTDYSYTKYKDETMGGQGFTSKHTELKQFFPNTGNTTPPTDTPPNP